MKFSFLIPVYNKEKFLKKCFDSIIKQKYGNYEVIIVDDCSTDNSVKIIEEYTSKNNKFRLYKNEQNMQISYNRNKLIDLSTGDYLIFVDPDDYISDTLLTDILPFCEQNADLIKVHIEHIHRPEKDDKDKYNFYFEKEVVDSDKAIEIFVEEFKKHYAIIGSYIIKKTIFTDYDIKYPTNISIHEDVAVTPIIISFSKKIVFLNKVGYYYVENINGISNSYYKKDKWVNEENKYDAFQSAVLYALKNVIDSNNISPQAKLLLVTDLLKRAELL